MGKLVETILASLPVGLLIMEADGTITEASDSTCDILGCPAEGFVGRKWGDLFLSDDTNLAFAGVVFDAIQNEVPTIETVTPYQMEDGEEKYLSVISSALREEDKISEIVVMIEDLTELNRLHVREKAILQQNHKLANQRAESLIAFAQSVAHQIRNPITAIGGLARIIERRMSEETLEPLEAIKEEALKLETMVRAVAEYSAIALTQVAPVNLWVILEGAKRQIEKHPAVMSKNITWKTECPDMNVKVDRESMISALSELFLNSAEFSGDKASITVYAKEEYPNTVITVEDSGSGFTDKGLEMAFDPFYSTKTVGAGMGLTRAKRIINEHQGNIDIENLDRGGARVRVSLPSEAY